MNNVTPNISEQRYEKPDFANKMMGMFAASAVSTSALGVMTYFTPNLLDRLVKLTELSKDEFNQVDKASKKALQDTGLAKKGVHIEKIPTITEPLKTLKEKAIAALSPVVQLQRGQNAMFLPDKKLAKELKIAPNAIAMPEKNLLLAVFHEMGHAANLHLSQVGKILQKSRAALLLTGPISLIALYKDKKAPGEKSNNIFGKATDYIKNHVAILSALCFVPVVIEEAMASIKGIKFAKEAGLAKDLLNKMSKSYKVAFVIYAGGALATVGLIKAMVKVKDSITKPRPINN